MEQTRCWSEVTNGRCDRITGGTLAIEFDQRADESVEP